MAGPLAFRNGEFVPPEQLFAPVYDTGFMQGATVAEQMRTFAGQLFSLQQHLDRLKRSLEIVCVDPGFEVRKLGEFATRLAENNHALLADGDDLGLSLFVTPGAYPTFSSGDNRPLVGMHTYPLPFGTWSERYRNGQSLVITDYRQVPESCWPAELKCRSRMHYYLADRAAAKVEPGARALMLDQDGFVCEASTANIVLYKQSVGLVAPPASKVLPGISVAMLKQIAEEQKIGYQHQELTEDDVLNADEVLLTSTSPCLIPVTKVNGQPIGGGEPGPIFRQLLGAWSDGVGVDILAQTQRFASR